MKRIKLYKGRKYSLCSCGVSKNLPFCDNEHRSYNEKHGTDYKSVKITSDKTTEVELTSSKWIGL